jgi:hypothetical protein
MMRTGYPPAGVSRARKPRSSGPDGYRHHLGDRAELDTVLVLYGSEQPVMRSGISLYTQVHPDGAPPLWKASDTERDER